MNKLKQNVTDLANLLDKINATRELAECDLDNADWRTRPGLEVRKSQAKMELEDLFVEYSKILSNTVYKVFVDGTQEQVTKLAELLRKEGVEAFVAPSLYEEVANKITFTLGTTGEFTPTSYVKTVEFLTEYAIKYKVQPTAPFKEEAPRGLANHDELVNVIRQIARQAFGENLNKTYLFHIFTETALKENFDKNVSVVLFSNVTADEKAKLSELLYPEQPSISITFDAGEAATKSLAAKIYRRISETKLQEVKTNKATETKGEVNE